MNKIISILLIAFTISVHAQTFTATVNEYIPDNGTEVSFDIIVSGLPPVIDTAFGLETVCINIDHTWDADLELYLMAPDGTEFLLFNGVGGDGDNFTNTCFNKYAATSITSGYAPFTGEYIPQGDMGIINNGQNPNGTWKLICKDNAAADIGLLNNWEITFGNEPALPFAFTESNLPIIIINTDGAQIYDEPKTAATFKIIDNGPGIMNHPEDTDYAFDGNILTELQGYTGPYYPKKNYDFDLVNTAGIEIDTTLLGLPSENDFILKAEYLDLTLIKNTLAYSMYRRMGRYAPRTRFCELILNGEYLGVFTLTEKVKRDANRVNIASLTHADTTGDALTGGYIFEMNINGDAPDWTSIYPPINNATSTFNVEFQMVYPHSDSVEPQQLNYIQTYTDSFENILQGPYFLDSINGYRKLISVKSFIDFMLINEFSANYDSYGRSTYLYKEKITDGGQLNIGPPWDYDRAYLNWTTTGWVWEITHAYWPYPFWWKRFRDDPQYRNEVFCRYTSLRENTWSIDSVNAFIDSCAALLHDAAIRNFAKWPELGVTDYDAEVNNLKQFMLDRFTWMDDTLSYDYVEPPDASFLAFTADTINYLFTPAELNADSYTWNFGDGAISTEQFPAHQYADSGSYIVTLTINKYYGCASVYSSSVQSVGVPVDGITVLNAENISVYPNPANEFLFIDMQTNSENKYEIIIQDASGKIVLQKKLTEQFTKLDIKKLPANIYFLMLYSESGNRYAQKLIKK